MIRRRARRVQIGNSAVGGEEPILIQTMPTTKTSKVAEVLAEIHEIVEAGCGMIRVAVLDNDDARAIKDLKKEMTVPLCADIHFNFKLGLEAMKNGADKIRINPGNIGSDERIREVIKMAKEKNIAIRIGVNSGSLDEPIYDMENRVKGMVEFAKQKVAVFEEADFRNIIISIKSSNVQEMIQANRLIANQVDYPLHLGVTEAGGGMDGVIKSVTGIGTLLNEGIGDTIRVSLTDPSVKEIEVCKKLLRASGRMKYPYEIIACPTCGRIDVDVIKMAQLLEDRINSEFDVNKMKYKKISLMGCVVNGPGESIDADIGLVGGRGFGYIYKKGKKEKRIEGRDIELVDALIEEMKK